jgi:hypothetical protein
VRLVSENLDDRLAALAYGPLPAPAPAERVRRRGEQRRRRARAAAAAVAIAVVAGTGAGVLAFARADQALQYAPQPDPSAVRTAAPSADPAPPPVAEPSGAPDAPEPQPVSYSLLLQPADAQRISAGDWTAAMNAGESQPGLQVCPEPAERGEAGSKSVIQLPGDGEAVVSQVIRFARPGANVVQTLRDDLARCPSRPGESDQPGSTISFEPLTDPASGVLAFRMRYTGCAGCGQDLVRFWLVTATGRHVSFTVLFPSQEQSLGKWAIAARQRLSRAPSGG